MFFFCVLFKFLTVSIRMLLTKWEEYIYIYKYFFLTKRLTYFFQEIPIISSESSEIQSIAGIIRKCKLESTLRAKDPEIFVWK